MHLRALIVLLLAMNLGVALWWALRPAPDAEPMPGLPADVPRLVLVSEAGAAAMEGEASNAADASAHAGGPGADTDEVELDGLQCFSFGAWADAGEAGAALAALRPLAVLAREREAPSGASAWRVMLPPLESREAAQAVVARLLEAGFDDHFIMGQGEEANAIALGRFSAEASARSHEAALRAAGFEAVADAVGATGSEAWIDVAAEEGFDPEAAREAAGAIRAEAIDCARLQ